MTDRIAINPGVGMFGSHDPGAALFQDDELVFAIEEERLSRTKHAPHEFPERSIQACIDAAETQFEEIDRIVVPWDPALLRDTYLPAIKRAGKRPRPVGNTLRLAVQELGVALSSQVAMDWLRRRLSDIGQPVPQIDGYGHHKAHAASAIHPAPFTTGLVLTLDGRGERCSGVVWRKTDTELERLRTFYYPNSLGFLFGAVTKFLGFRPHNGEGKVMGLAAYGDENPAIESIFRNAGTFGAEFDVRNIVLGDARPGLQLFEGDFGFFETSVRRLETLFDRDRKSTPTEFTAWEQDLAYVAQKLLEETVTDLVREYIPRTGSPHVAIAGGVGLNVKSNQRVRQLDCVEQAYFQPVAHDAGAAVGAGILASSQPDQIELPHLSLGPEYDSESIVELLERNHIQYSQPPDLAANIARDLADGNLVGWFQGRLEFGPRALGNRSILADPRSVASRDRINASVKHRAAWRPFAPSVLRPAADRYFSDVAPAPFMIETMPVDPETRQEIPAVLHPEDGTARPQLVTKAHHPAFYRLIEAFAELTGVPVLLNTSLNDSGNPIVNTPGEAIKAFYGMGLDVLVLEDVVIRK